MAQIYFRASYFKLRRLINFSHEYFKIPVFLLILDFYSPQIIPLVTFDYFII